MSDGAQEKLADAEEERQMRVDVRVDSPAANAWQWRRW